MRFDTPSSPDPPPNRFHEREHPYEWLAIVLLAGLCLAAGRWAHIMVDMREAVP